MAFLGLLSKTLKDPLCVFVQEVFSLVLELLLDFLDSFLLMVSRVIISEFLALNLGCLEFLHPISRKKSAFLHPAYLDKTRNLLQIDLKGMSSTS